MKRAGVSLVDYSNWFNFDTCNGMELEKVLKLVMFATLSHHFELKIHTTYHNLVDWINLKLKL